MVNEPRLAVESIAGQRPYQEDSVLAENLTDGRLLIAVADGMGGHAAGEVASALALETLVSALNDGHPLDTAFAMANTHVHDKAQEPGRQGMGTTLVAAVVDGEEYSVANVGDSRGYLVSRDGIRRLTEDHSFVAEAMKRGQTEAEAMATPWKDALTRSIGTESEVEIDVFGPFPVKEDTALLLCSDGLYKTLSDDDLRRVFVQSSGVRGSAQSLVSSAFENGSDDNISVVIAEYGEVAREVMQGTMPISYLPDLADDLGSVRSGEGAMAVTEDYDATADTLTNDALGSEPISDMAVADAKRSVPVGAIVAVAAVVSALIAYVVLS